MFRRWIDKAELQSNNKFIRPADVRTHLFDPSGFDTLKDINLGFTGYFSEGVPDNPRIFLPSGYSFSHLVNEGSVL